jgi:hypothetical protein
MNRDELHEKIREAADMVDSQFVSPRELDGWIDLSLRNLHALLVSKYGADYWSTETWIQVRPGTDPNIAWPRFAADAATEITGPELGYSSAYALPDDFLRVVRVQFLAGTVQRVTGEVGELGSHAPLRSDAWRLVTTDRTAYPMHQVESTSQLMCFDPLDWAQTNVGYRLRHGPRRCFRMKGTDQLGAPVYQVVTHTGSIIEFLPVPASQYAVQVTYVHKPMLLPDHPHIEYVVADCAAQMLEKEQSDSSALRQRQSFEINLIEQGACKPQASRPRQIQRMGGSNRISYNPARGPYR